MKRRVFGIIIAVVLALVGVGVLVSYVQGAEDRALAGQKTVEVLVAAEAIEAGTPAGDLDGKLEIKTVTANVRAEGAVTSIDQLGERVSEIDLLPGDQIVKARFVDADEAQAGAATAEDGENMLQATVALEPERALGGLIKPGDTVGVVASFEIPDTSSSTTHLTLQAIQITNVQLEQSSTAVESEGGEQADDDEAAAAPTGRFLVTLSVDAPSLERLVFAAEHGTVWLASERVGSDSTGAGVVTITNIFA